jgi:hypothetical protein
VATFGLYADNGSKAPGSLVASVTGVSLQPSVAQEILASNVVLVPGTYYFAILARDDGEPLIYSSTTLMTDTWYGGVPSYDSGLPTNYDSLPAEVFTIPQMNIYLVVRQSGT